MSDFPNQQSSSGVWTQLDQYRAQAISNWPVASDPLFPYTSLLISGDGPDKFDNNTILDSGPYNLNVTRNGNVSQGGFSPFGEGWSVYFDGIGDFLSIPSGSLDFIHQGAVSWTCECWFYSNSTAQQTIISTTGSTAQTGFGLYVNTTAGTGDISLQIYRGSSGNSYAGTTPNNIVLPNKWYHLAVTFNGTTKAINIYLNGVSQTVTTSGTATFSASTATYAPNIGRFNTASVGAGGYFSGNISNLRIINSVITYTSNFTPSTSPLTTVSSTILLTCCTNKFADISNNRYSIGTSGTPRVSRSNPFKTSLPYNSNPVGSSVYFDGAGDYLTLPASQSSLYLTGAFTWEAWIYPTANSSSYLYGNWANQAGQNAWSFIFSSVGTFSTGFKLFWYRGNYGTNQSAIGSTTGLTLNKWNHFAITRDASNNIRMFVDGVQLTLTTYNEALTWDNSYSFTSTSAIGINGNATYPNSTPLYISNLRFIQGTAIYTANFTPPAQPLTAVSGTSLLTCSGNGFVDNSTNNIAITRVGNAAVSELSPFNGLASFTPSFAGRSVYFDGNGDWLSAPFNTALTFGGGNFTIECWVYPNRVTSTSMAIAGIWDSISGAPQSWVFGLDSLGRPYFVTDDGGTPGDVTIFTSSVSVLNNTWTHLAVTRSGNTWRLFINGAINQTATNALTMRTGSAVFYIGTYQNKSAGDNTFNGYIADFRIVKGTAVYTSNFTPSTEPLTAISGTTLLTCQQGSIVDASTSNIVLTPAGDAAASSLTLKDPYSPYLLTGLGGSVYFTGTSTSYLNVPVGASTFGTGNFTVECWFYVTSLQQSSILNNTTGNTDNNYWSLAIEVDGSTNFQIRDNTSQAFAYGPAGSSYRLNAWNHLVGVRNSGSVTVYLNGVAGTPVTITKTVTARTTNIGASRYTGFETYLTGYLSNVRIITGTALYTTNFTPPTTLLTAVANTALLTCIDNGAFIDRSSNNFTITSGATPLANSFDPFRNNLEYNPLNISGSLYFDGTGDYLSIPVGSNINLTNSDFTIECWVYIQTLADGRVILSHGWPTINSEYLIYLDTVNNKISFYASSTGSSWDIANAVSIVPSPKVNTWYHIAITRRGTNFRTFADGVLTTAFTNSTSLFSTTSYAITVGSGVTGATANCLNGYISNLRIIKGIALYVNTFTPPTAPLKSIAGTSLLLEGTNVPVLDHTGRSNIETVGNAQVVTAQSKWGSSSLYFDGTGDYLTMPNTVTVFGTGDFTVECWVNTTVIDSTNDTVISNYNTGSTNAMGLYINRGSNGGVQFYYGTTLVLNAATAITLTNTWYHIAVARSSGVSRLFINGVQTASANDTGNYATDAALTYIGAATVSNVVGNYLNGYIDDLRVTAGIARYTSDFNPPGQFAKM